MRVAGPAGAVHLTYCTNVHPGESWVEVRRALEHYLPRVKSRVSPRAPLAVGLRLSAAAADSLSAPAETSALRAWLAANDLYLLTINGFPYGSFHGTRVKEAVYRPDWRSPERLRYTNVLADLCAELLPDGLAASISTVPGAFRSEVREAADVAAIAEGIARHAAHLVALERTRGVVVRLAIEPEPCCFLETIDETVAFFNENLFRGVGRDLLATQLGLDPGGAERAMRQHVGICLDLCHAAVEFEDAEQCIAALRSAGIAIPKVQVSSGLRIARVDAAAVERLRAFEEPVYLHQVTERRGDSLRRFVDLHEARAAFDPDSEPSEWRIHFHVPVFRADMDALSTTRPFIEQVLAQHRVAPISEQFEVETYTFDVLPAAYRGEDLVTHLARELEWTAGALA